MVSYVVSASIFILGSSYLLHFVVEPPGSAMGGNLEHMDLRSKADQALGVLVGTPGYPVDWDASVLDIESVQRLGLVESGTTIRIDPTKFDAVAKGRLLTASSGNGGVDYAEAKAALGLSGYEFHMRAYPLMRPGDDGLYGLEDFDDFRVAYVGDFSNGIAQPAATAEIGYLDGLNIDFEHLPGSLVPDDVVEDNSGDIRDELLPHIGVLVQQTKIAKGSGTSYQFMRVASSTYAALAPPGGTTALALSSDGATLGYVKNLELRAIVGKADLSGVSSATLAWSEYVDTDRGNSSYDCEDYGFAEVSPDDGATWIRLTDSVGLRSADCASVSPVVVPHGAAMKPKSVADITLACPACANNDRVLVAYHWVADNDNTVGYGWVIDDVSITAGASTIMRKTFESPEYDLLIVGSNVDNNAFEPNDVKEALRDYVDVHGGRILITGPATNVNWLDRLFDAGIAGAGGGVSTPDVTHPLLTLPNPLAYESYPRGNNWVFGANGDADLFSAVVAESELKHVLSVSRLGAWGNGATNEGSVILSSYLPYQMGDPAEAKRFFANAITYGKFHYLYADVGPAVPDDEAVGSAVRTATMNMYRTGDASYTEMVFIFYVWPGASTAQTAGPVTIPATPPTEASATAGNSEITLKWKRPLDNGSALPVRYHIYRGFSPESTAEVGIPAQLYESPVLATPTFYTYVDTVPDNGVTYYYTIRLETSSGVMGAPTAALSATPLGTPDAPGTPTAVPAAGKLAVEWTAPQPGSTGGGTIFGYRVLSTTTPADPNSFVAVGEVGNVTSFDHIVPDQVPRAYKVQAVNGAGWGTLSDASAPAAAIVPIAPPTLNVVTDVGPGNLTLTWVAPDTAGQTLLGYRVLRSSTGAPGTFTQLAYLNSAANVSFIDVGLGHNQTRWYQVQGVTNFGDGQLSDAKSAKTMATPDTPAGLDVDALVDVRTVTWQPVTGSDAPVVRYDIYRGGSAATLQLVAEAASSPYVDSPGGGSFYYAVRAVSAAGASDLSAVVGPT